MLSASNVPDITMSDQVTADNGPQQRTTTALNPTKTMDRKKRKDRDRSPQDEKPKRLKYTTSIGAPIEYHDPQGMTLIGMEGLNIDAGLPETSESDFLRADLPG